MRIVIDIPEKYYEKIKKAHWFEGHDTILDRVYLAIKQGTILPKNHGRLIDEDALLVSEKECYRLGDCLECRMNVKACGDFEHAIKYAPTIIEAEKEDEHGREENADESRDK